MLNKIKYEAQATILYFLHLLVNAKCGRRREDGKAYL